MVWPADFLGLGIAAWVALLGDEPFEFPALHPDAAADVDDLEPVPGDLTLEAATCAAQLARGLIEGQQQGVGCGRGGGAGVCSGLHVGPRDDQPP